MSEAATLTLAWEALGMLAVAVLVSWATTRRIDLTPSARVLLTLVIVVPLALAVAFWTPAATSLAEQQAPARTAERDYVSSDTCRACHPTQHASWHASYHRTMTQVVSPETFAAPLEDVSIE